jgi:hypothetical protein
MNLESLHIQSDGLPSLKLNTNLKQALQIEANQEYEAKFTSKT